LRLRGDDEDDNDSPDVDCEPIEEPDDTTVETLEWRRRAAAADAPLEE
jgi:hypothetical protein